MWPDNETERDFLNFSGVADTVAEIIVQARGRPISIGVSEAWGIGKSSMIKLTKSALAAREKRDSASKYVFVEFNAWLYQGYDDARAALMDVIATKLEQEAEARQTGVDKVKALAKRIKWLRAAKLATTSAVSMYFGIPPAGAIGELIDVGRKVWTEGVGKEAAESAKQAAADGRRKAVTS